MFFYHYFKDQKPKTEYSNIRWTLLVLISFLAFTVNYSFDLPSPLQGPLQNEVLNINTSQYNLFYGSFSFFNIFISLLIGYLLEICHERFILFIMTIIMPIGQFIFIIGLIQKDFFLALFGRVFVGLGCLNLYFIISYYCNKWFKFHEIGLAVGIVMASYKLAISIVNLISPILYKEYGIVAPTSFCLLLTILAVICVFIINYYDKQYKIKTDKQQTELLIDQSHITHSVTLVNFKFSDLKDFDLNFWIYVSIYLAFVSSHTVYQGNMNLLLSSIYKISSTQAGILIFIVGLFNIILCVVFGKIIDNSENKFFYFRLTYYFFFLSILGFLFLPLSFKYIPLFATAQYYILFEVSFWALISQSITVVQEKIGMSIIYSSYGLGVFLISSIFGFIRDNTMEYKSGFMFPAIALCLFGLYSLLISYKIKSGLNITLRSIKQIKELSFYR